MATKKKNSSEAATDFDDQKQPVDSPYGAGFEEWRMEKVNGKLEKLKLVRKGVKITQETADTLNSGAESAVNPIMYLSPE